ncbi:MAG TPA: hypothetical protein VL069_06830 [Opitutus sp.]|nr:hypothetical protein [Opitutus sp.]
MTSLRLGFLLSAICALVVAGCSSAPSFRGSVNVTLLDVRSTDISLASSQAPLTLQFTNESIAPLGYSKSTHRLYLNGKYAGKGESARPFGIPPQNSITREVTFDLENPATIRQLVSSSDSQTVSYRLESVLFQTVYEDDSRIKVESEGTVTLGGTSRQQ